MDHVDWLDTPTAQELADNLAKQVAVGGIVIWRSASLRPPYADLIAKAGFDVKRIDAADQGYMDKVGGPRVALVPTSGAHILHSFIALSLHYAAWC